jgi:undecaprenyl pyrophosphate synthase
MNHNEFTVLFSDVVDECKKTANKKAAEYSPNEDRLESFYAGNAYGVNAYQNCMTHMAKHITAIQTYVSNVGRADFDMPILNELFEDRLKDLIIYCILMIAIHTENTQQDA